MDRVDSLSDFPESGTPLDAKRIIHSNYRFVVSGHHPAFYRVGKDCIFVDRALDGRSYYLRRPFGLDDSATDMYVSDGASGEPARQDGFLQA